MHAHSCIPSDTKLHSCSFLGSLSLPRLSLCLFIPPSLRCSILRVGDFDSSETHLATGWPHTSTAETCLRKQDGTRSQGAGRGDRACRGFVESGLGHVWCRVAVSRVNSPPPHPPHGMVPSTVRVLLASSSFCLQADASWFLQGDQEHAPTIGVLAPLPSVLALGRFDLKGPKLLGGS